MIKIAAMMLGDGLNSPLYREIREKRGLCYRIWASADRFNDDHLFTISTTMEEKNVAMAADVLIEILQSPAKYLTKERLEIVRRQLIIEDKMEAINRYYHVHPWLTPEKYQMRTIQETVTLEQVHQAVLEHLQPDQLGMFLDTHGYLVHKCGKV